MAKLRHDTSEGAKVEDSEYGDARCRITMELEIVILQVLNDTLKR